MIVLVGLLIAGIAAWYQAQRNDERAEARFAVVAAEATSRVEARLNLYERGLRGARAMVLAAGRAEVKRQTFLDYVLARDLPNEFPGARGFGFAKRIRRGEEAALLAALADDGIDDVEIHTLGEVADERYIVLHVAPVPTNREALGLDMASEPVRRAASDRACDTGQVTVTAPLRLIQSPTSAPEGLLLLLPVYEPGLPLRTPSERRAACFGWTAAPLLIHEILAEQDGERGHTSISVHDVGDEAAPLRVDEDASAGASLRATSVRPIFGRRWRFEVQAKQAFVDELALPGPSLVFALGALGSALLAGLVHLFLVALARQRQIVTHEHRLAAIVENSSDAIVSETIDGVIVSWNRAAERIFGYKSNDALGRHSDDLLRPEAGDDGGPEALSSARLGVTIPPHDVRCRRSDGTPIDVAVTLSPVIARGGEVIGVGRMLRDVGPYKDAERRLHEFNAALERKVAERTDELAGTTRHLRTILDTVPAAIAYWDRGLINRFANVTYTRWVGGDPIGRTLREVLGDRVYGLVLPRVERVLQGERQQFEEHFGMVDGRPAHVYAQHIPDLVDGEVRGFYVMVQDVSEIQEGRERLQDILRGTDAGTWEWNYQTGVLQVDDRWAAILGYTRAELEPVTVETLIKLIHPDDVMITQEARRRHFEGETDVIDLEVRLRHRDGHWVWVHDCGRVASRTRDGRPLWVRGTRQDATARREAQRRLAESEAFLERAGHLARIGGWQLEVDTERLEWTREVKRIHEVPLDYQPNLAEAIQFYPDEALTTIQEAVHRATVEGVGYDLVLPFVTATGRALWVRTICEVEHVGEGEARRVVRLFGAFQDITEQRKAEEALREATRVAERASAAKSEFVANMSHEIRTPLHAILGIAHLLGVSRLDPEQRGYVAKIQLAGQNLLDVVNDILDLSKIEAGELGLNPAPFDLRSLISDFESVFGPPAASKGLTLAICLPFGLPERFIGDAARIRQILTNLVGNAIKFTEAGSVEVRVELEGRVADLARVRFIVRDTGIGMPTAALGQIFQPFVQADSSTTRRFGGTGLGLSIVHRLTTLMNGEVTAASELGKGSEFRVTLPLALPATPTPIEPVPERRRTVAGDALAGVRILVVDDSEINREIACHLLACEGASVCGAADGLEAFERLADGPHDFDVVLMDLQMPVMDGNEATRRIRGELGLVDLPVIALTAGTLRGAKKRAYDAGIDDFLSKPLDPRILIQTIAGHVERSRLKALHRASVAVDIDDVRMA